MMLYFGSYLFTKKIRNMKNLLAIFILSSTITLSAKAQDAVHLKPSEATWRFRLAVLYLHLDKHQYAIEQKAILKTLDNRLAEDLGQLIWRKTSSLKNIR